MSYAPQVDPTYLTIDGQLVSSPKDDLPPLVHDEGHKHAKATTQPPENYCRVTTRQSTVGSATRVDHLPRSSSQLEEGGPWAATICK